MTEEINNVEKPFITIDGVQIFVEDLPEEWAHFEKINADYFLEQE